jgi:hypothetical protein
MRTFRAAAALSAVLALAACGFPARTGAGSPAQAPAATATVTAPGPATVTAPLPAPVPQTVVVAPPQTVYVQPKSPGVAADRVRPAEEPGRRRRPCTSSRRARASPQTVYVQPKSPGVAATGQWYAQPSWIHAQPWITLTPAAGQTACQWLYARGYTYAQAYAAWAQNGYPASWSATGDGYPCQKSYGAQH